jgi:Zn-dependent peptidase ImmA (M78 family)/DNA-binding XRE family transcriptional regulator
MRSFKVDVSPDVLVWARRSSGLSTEEAAEKIKVSETELRMWEVGAEDPTLENLRELARIYKYALAVMLLPEPPTGLQVLRDFRLMPENQGRDWSPALRRQIRRLQYQQQVARDLAAATEELPLSIDLDVDLNENPESAAQKIRAWILKTAPIYPSGNDHPSLQEWTGVVEDKGILVTQVEGVALEEMRGCSISTRPYPVIALNGKDSQTGKLFTLFHELTHILLNEEALCDLADNRASSPNQVEQVERFCDQVGAAVLMPAKDLLTDPVVNHTSKHVEWPNEELLRLAAQFRVSAEALLLRLVSLDKASSEFYWSKRPYFVASYREMHERERARLKESHGGPSPYRMKIRNLGRRYITDILDAYDRDLIDPSDVSDYLDIKINNLPKLVGQLAS